jgi:tRNA 2-thiocytidine biosynthesis protein TtcA
MRNISPKGFGISNKIGKAISDFNLIEEGDRILVGVSGGKDSLTLLKMLIERRKWSPVRFDVAAAHIVTDKRCAGCVHNEVLQGIFESWGCEYRFVNISLESPLDKKNSCFWCSWNRRKALFLLADSLGCNKVAFGHHKDDVIETILMNMFYNGEISSVNARQPLFEGKLTIIRPLVYVEERDIKAYAAESGFPLQLCRCPNSMTSKRAAMKKLISGLEDGNKMIKSNIFRAPSRIRGEYLGLTDRHIFEQAGKS